LRRIVSVTGWGSTSTATERVSVRVSADESGRSLICVAYDLSIQGARVSGRVVATKRIGAPARQSASVTRYSTELSSIQCRSSTTSTVGCLCAALMVISCKILNVRRLTTSGGS
jgi:hypothetical protein